MKIDLNAIANRLLDRLTASRGNDIDEELKQFTPEEIRAAEQAVMEQFMQTGKCDYCSDVEFRNVPVQDTCTCKELEGYAALAASQDEEDKAFHEAMRKRREHPKPGDRRTLKNGVRVVYNGKNWVALGAIVPEELRRIPEEEQ